MSTVFEQPFDALDTGRAINGASEMDPASEGGNLEGRERQ